MKSVFISIKPEWCELIAEGKKTMEVRKSAPKLDTPFKVYIYCTKGDSQFSQGDRFCLYAPPHDTPVNANQTVIGEFVCDIVEPYWFDKDEPNIEEYEDVQHSCVPGEELLAYADGKQIYFWHISQLKIYDKPKYLGRFIVPSNIGCCNEGKCRGCRFFIRGNAMAGIEADCTASFNTDEYKPLRRPPQSWCYVEEIDR